MKTILTLFLGIVLIVGGTAVLTYQGVTFTTAERQILHVGPLLAGTEQANWTVTLPPILGALLLAGGVVIVFVIAIVRRTPRYDKASKPLAEARVMAPHAK